MKIKMNDNVNINAIDLYRDEFKLKYDVSKYRWDEIDEQTKMFIDELWYKIDWDLWFKT